MVELLITNQQLIKQIINRTTCELKVKINMKNKRAFFKTDRMSKYKAISMDRVKELI